MKILIVEDSKTDSELLEGLLKSQGTCEHSEDTEDAIEKFQEALNSGTPYDLVCLDIKLPSGDGKETLKKMREIEKARGIVAADRSTIVMTTANGDVKSVLKATNIGCDGYVVKPISKERLYAELCKFGLIKDWDAKKASPFLR